MAFFAGQSLQFRRMGFRHDEVVRRSDVRLGVRESADSLQSAMNKIPMVFFAV